MALPAQIGSLPGPLLAEPQAALRLAREAQRLWAQVPLRRRLALLRRARHSLAAEAPRIAQSVPCEQPGSLQRNFADTLVSEVLPLLEACRFLEREAAWILRPQRLSGSQRPFWLRRVDAQTSRDPLGVVLIIAPANYPLFLPGVQILQALAAGNAVLCKPAPGGMPAAQALRGALVRCGLDPALLQLLHESPQSAADAIACGVEKVFLTGSAHTGAAVLAQLAPHITPAVAELSGCDAVFVLPGASIDRVVAALAFGLRLNGSATCMAPRRLFLVGEHPALLPALLEQCRALPVVRLPPRVQAQLDDVLQDARSLGGEVLSDPLRYAVITGAVAGMKAARSDIFAPLLSVFSVPDAEAAVAAHAACPYALTASVFGAEGEARALASRLSVGTVLINDVIMAAADPRLSFGGRKQSGFGLTRGPEGLLEMTALKTTLVQRSRDLRPYRPTTPAHEIFFSAYLELAHGGTWSVRWRGMRRLLSGAARLGRNPGGET